MDDRDEGCPVMVVAHRGDRARCPENTLPAVRSALESGASAVEVDVRFTADDVPVVAHDPDLERTGGDRCRIAETTYDDLVARDVGEPSRFGDRYRGTRVPRLDEIAHVVASHPDCTWFVEIKSCPAGRAAAARVDGALAALGPARAQAVIIGFEVDVVRAAREADARGAGLVVPDLDDVRLDVVQALAPDYVFCPRSRVPAAPWRFWPGPWRWIPYEIATIADALPMVERGAHGVETDDLAPFLADPRFT